MEHIELEFQGLAFIYIHVFFIVAYCQFHPYLCAGGRNVTFGLGSTEVNLRSSEKPHVLVAMVMGADYRPSLR